MATEPAQEEGPPLTELESLQLKANQVTDESLDSTRRMITLCEDSQAAGIKTIEMLEHQGEQLTRIEEGMDTMHGNMKDANKHLTGMEKWCGLCVCPWNRPRKIAEKDVAWNNKGEKEKNSSGRVVNSQPPKGTVPDSGNGKGQYIKRITNDAREDEMEENMQAVGNVLGNLKNMAEDMGTEITKQNKGLDRAIDKGGNVDLQINRANERAKKLLQ